MNEIRVWLEPDLIARLELVTLAEYRDDVFAAELGDYLDLGTGRLDHLDVSLDAVIGDDEMLGPDAVDRGASVAARRGRGQRQARAAQRFELHFAVEANGAFQEIHRRRADEAGDKKILRFVIELERSADLPDQAVVHQDDL